MTTTSAPSHVDLLLGPAPRSSFAGTGVLLRVALRRDRVRIPVWVVFSAFLTIAVAQSWDRLYPDVESRLQLARTLALDPTLSSILGPLFAPLSTGGLTAWRISAGMLCALGLVSSFLVVRHTRADESAGRIELLRGGPVGSAAPALAAMLAAAVMLGAFAVLTAVSLAALGLGVGGSIAFALTQSAGCLVFAGVAAITAQVARSSRGANGLAGLALGLAFVVTSLGNAQDGGSPLQWVTPFGWAQQTRSYADERWWLIALSLGVAVVLGAIALHVAARRDVGDALLAQRHGRTGAPGWIAGPIALAWRLDRATILVWAIGFALVGAVEGSLLTTSVDLVKKSPGLAEVILRLAGGTTNLNDAFLVTMTGLFGLLAAGFGISTGLRLRAEEEDGRAELILSTARSRVEWITGHSSTALVGATALLGVGGLSLGLVFGASSGDPLGQAWRAMLATLVCAPATWAVVAVPLFLVGVRPRLAGPLGWLVLVWCVIAGYFGAILGLPDWLQQTSPFGHIPLWPATPMTWTPLIVLTLIAWALVVGSHQGIRRRDVPA